MTSRNRVHVIACGVLAVDIRRCARELDTPLTLEFLEGGLHDRPAELRRRLQEAVDRASLRGDCDRIVLGYGACGRGLVSIVARSVPLMIPNAQDCIALFLGSDQAYRRQFLRQPGTFYVSAGWHEERAQPLAALADGSEAPSLPAQGLHGRLADQYGSENAAEIEAFLESWRRHYRRAVFIDTGTGQRETYRDAARQMADRFGWRYEELPGDLRLLRKLLTAETGDGEVARIEPGYVIHFDPISEGLKGVPPGADPSSRSSSASAVAAGAAGGSAPGPFTSADATLGLGIDAGGTYTDAVLYDFSRAAVVARAKALTTPWDFTIGISQALDGLGDQPLDQVDIVALSTTLATNAIVEGRGQKVGLLLFPPYALKDSGEFGPGPVAVLQGRMDVEGRELTPVDEAEIARVAREMVRRDGVRAFAVSGFGAVANPAHEQVVRQVVQEATGAPVSCGHELSGRLNFRTRADTAALNGRIMPVLAEFLTHIRQTLDGRGVAAPVMVARGDGTLISESLARERPVETILSGPAASVNGARRLTGRGDAVVVDMGGTTTDVAILVGGEARLHEEGARVGGWRTHVRALDIRTGALGGDSRIRLAQGDWRLGPERVCPVARLAAERPAVAEALDWMAQRLDACRSDTLAMDLIAATGRAPTVHCGDRERRVLDLVAERPRSTLEIADALGLAHWKLVPLEGLDEERAIVRAALTPTDVLHIVGRFAPWDGAAARRMGEMMASLAGLTVEALAERALEKTRRGLVAAVVDAMLGGEGGGGVMDRLIAGNGAVSGGPTLRFQLDGPLIGLGAPAPAYLAEVARTLGTEAIFPDHGDVANAVGAVTAWISVTRAARVAPDGQGGYAVRGFPGTWVFGAFDGACAFAVERLEGALREEARAAGAGRVQLRLAHDDRLARSAQGTDIFLERVITATASGPPAHRQGRQPIGGGAGQRCQQG